MLPKSKVSTIFILCGFGASCASDVITFSSDKKATVSIVSFTDPNGDGQIVGESPQSLEFDKIEKKVVKIWGEGLTPQYWVFAPYPDANTEVRLTMKELPKGSSDQSGQKKPDDQKKNPGEQSPDKGESKTDDPLTTLRISSRMVMRAYAALAARNYDSARELAKKVQEIAPTIAAPHLIIGIAHLSEGQKQAAKEAFEVAISLDPEDLDAQKLLDAAR